MGAVDLARLVKPLEWVFAPTCPTTGCLPHYNAQGIGGHYLIECLRGYGDQFDLWHPNQVSGTRFDTKAEAISAANADHAARVLAALDAELLAELVGALDDALDDCSGSMLSSLQDHIRAILAKLGVTP